jgi:hypothetical protein
VNTSLAPSEYKPSYVTKISAVLSGESKEDDASEKFAADELEVERPPDNLDETIVVSDTDLSDADLSNAHQHVTTPVRPLRRAVLKITEGNS